MARQQLDISQLGLEELQNLQQQLSSEVQNFTSNMVALQQTAGRFAMAAVATELSAQEERVHQLRSATQNLSQQVCRPYDPLSPPVEQPELCLHMLAQLDRLHTMQRAVDQNTVRVFETAKQMIKDLDSEMRQIRDDAPL